MDANKIRVIRQIRENPRFRRYPEYKESGVEWIGEIPVNWKILPFRHCLKKVETKKKTSIPKMDYQESGEFPIIDQGASFIAGWTDLTASVISDNLPIVIFGDHTRIFKYVDFPFTLGADGTQLLYPNDDILNPRFFYYALLNLKIPNEGYSRHYKYLREFSVTCPTLPTQRQIVKFLDRKTKQIDELIRIKERRIELLQEQRTALINQTVTKGLDPNVEMKPPGVEWIGEIPKHWEVKRIKYLASLISKGTTPTTIGRDILDEGEIRFIKVENIVDNQIEFKPGHYIDEETNQLLKRSQLKENDVLFVIAGATIGKVSLVKSSHLPANTNQAISFIRLHEKELPEFICYWLQSDNIQKMIWLKAVQSAQPNLSMEDLGNLYVPSPSIAEQRQIVKYIADKTQTIVQFIQQAYKQIELLKEYRQSLISEAVTGKIDVRSCGGER